MLLLWTSRTSSKPVSLRSDVLTWAHTSRIACHGGVHRTLHLLRRRFYWPSMTRDVREYIAACTTCARSKTSHSPPSGLLHPLPTPSRPWSHIALPTATETADILVHHVFRHHGIPSNIVSDRGPQFCSQVWKAFCSALGATVSLTSGYHPQSNGQAERANQELEASLRCLAADNPSDWSKYLVWIEYAHNSQPSSATGVSPFEASLGFPPPLFPSHELDLAVPSIQEHLQRCQRVWQQTRAALLRTKESNCQTANRHRVVGPSYQPGQRPLSRSTRPSTSPRSSRSLTAVYARLPLPHHPPGSSMALRRTPLAASWTSGAGVAAISSWSIGRGMVLRNAPGSPVRSFWTPPLSPTSTVPTRIVVLDRLEAVVRGGVLSWHLCHPRPSALLLTPPAVTNSPSSTLPFLRRPSSTTHRQIVTPYGD
ncbi:uncharacterized protein LOC144994962 isoform X1 [Oryzias latipes]